MSSLVLQQLVRAPPPKNDRRLIALVFADMEGMLKREMWVRLPACLPAVPVCASIIFAFEDVQGVLRAWKRVEVAVKNGRTPRPVGRVVSRLAVPQERPVGGHEVLLECRRGVPSYQMPLETCR
jgi:hypothetical protein